MPRIPRRSSNSSAPADQTATSALMNTAVSRNGPAPSPLIRKRVRALAGLTSPVAGCGSRDAPGVDRAEPDFATPLAPHPGKKQIRCRWMFGGPAVGERHPVRAQHAQVAHQWLQAALVPGGADDRVGPKAAA